MNIRANDFGNHSGVPVPSTEPDRQVAVMPERLPSAQPYGSGFDEPRSQFDVLRFWGLFLKHKWLFASIVPVALILGYSITFLSTPIYRATGTIQIDREPTKVVDFHDDVRSASAGDSQFYQTQYELLKSRSLAERVVADLDLANQPTFLGTSVLSPWTKLRQMIFGHSATPSADASARKGAATARVQSGLTIKPVPNSALVNVSFNDPSPSWAVQIVTAFANAYIKGNLDHRFEATAYARTFLEDQLAQIRLKLEQSERELVAYAQKQQIVNFDDKQPPLAAADLLAVNTELAKVRAERIQNEQLYQQAQSTSGLGLPQILADQSIQMLRDKRMTLQTDYQDKLSTFKPDFPDMRKLRAQINEIDRQIDGAVSIIKQSIGAKYTASKQQEALLIKQLGENTTQVLDVQDRNIQYTILKREVDTNRSLYAALLQRYKDVGVGGGVGTNNISIVDAAEKPASPFSPSLPLNLGIALALGLAIAALAAYVLEMLDDTFKTPEQVEQALQIPVLGLAPLVGKNETTTSAFADPHSALSEAFRSIRTSLQFSTDGGAPKSFLVTSSRPAEGKSTAAIALARNFAQLSLRVLLIDADLRKPSLHTKMGCENGAGLSNFLVGAEIKSVIRQTETPGLMFISSGPLPPNPAELLAGPRLMSLLTVSQQTFDIVVIDGPPVMGLADALLLSSVTAGTLMVVGACDTPTKVVKRAMSRLHFARARMLGAMLSKFDARKVGFEYGYGYSNNYYSYDGGEPKQAITAQHGSAVAAGE